MDWTLQQIATDFNAISPAPATLSAGCVAVQALTVTRTVDVAVQAVAGYLGTAGKLASFMAWAAAPPAGTSAQAVIAADELSFAFDHPGLFPVFEMTNATIYAQMETWLGDLASPGTGITGPITATDQTAILALASVDVPKYAPAPGTGQLQRCQELGLISSTIPVV